MIEQRVGIVLCPYCQGTDLDHKRIFKEIDDATNELSGRMDIECENCGGNWAVKLEPVAYFTYSKYGGFNPVRVPLTPIALTQENKA